MSIRLPAVSGSFYPSDKSELESLVDGYLRGAKLHGGRAQILIAPHAGFVYSGTTAASAYKQLESLPKEHYTVVLVGPSHRVGFEGFALPFSDCFDTPLGSVVVNQEKIHHFLRHFANTFPVFKHDQPHKDEHSLETQLPFLQMSLEYFDIVPIVYGKGDYNHLSVIFEYFMLEKNSIIVISSDLSHFYDYDSAMAIDQHCNDGVLQLNLDELEAGEACGKIGIKAAVKYAKEHGLKSVLLDYRTSGDTAGDKARVVGYASYMLYEE